MVTEILVTFSGPVNAADADSVGAYGLKTPGKKGFFTAKNAKALKLKSAMYGNNEVTLTPKKAFALTMAVQLVVNGNSIQDSEGHQIDGANDGVAGSNSVTIIRRSTPVVATTPTPAATPTPPRTPFY
jgi:hypothetical protein